MWSQFRLQLAMKIYYLYQKILWNKIGNLSLHFNHKFICYLWSITTHLPFPCPFSPITHPHSSCLTHFHPPLPNSPIPLPPHISHSRSLTAVTLTHAAQIASPFITHSHPTVNDSLTPTKQVCLVLFPAEISRKMFCHSDTFSRFHTR